MDSQSDNHTDDASFSNSAQLTHHDMDIASLTSFKGWTADPAVLPDVMTANGSDAFPSIASLPRMTSIKDGGHLLHSTDMVPVRRTPEKPDSLRSDEEFELMVNDMRGTFVSWLKKTQHDLRNRNAELATAAEELLAEKKAFVERMKQERSIATEKLEEERRRHNRDIASQMKHIQFEREEARRRLEEEQGKLDHEKDVFQNYMQLENEKLRQRVELFEQDQRKVLDNKIATQTMVDINVGGVVFETSRHTLTSQPTSFLASLISGRHEVGRDRHGRIFLDRDYELFRLILNFMRDPANLPAPRDLGESTAIVNEAAYYKVRFSPYPLAICIGGHSGREHLSAVEVLDKENMCWRSCAPMQTPRMYFGAGVLNNFVYAFGGHNLDYKALCDTEMYDRLRNTWHTAASLRLPRRNNAGCVFNDRLFCVGGFDGLRVLDSVEAYDVRMKNWIESAPMNVPRSSPMLTPQNGCLYALGGTSGERLRSVERYDPRMNKWELLSGSLLKVRSAGAACTYNNELYMIGGIDNVHTIHNSMETWDSKLQSSRYLMEAPLELMDTTLTCYSDSLLLAGGQNAEVSDSTFFYMPEKDEWSNGPSLLTPRYGHCTVYLDI